MDASIVEVPRQRNSRDENARIKSGEPPQQWPEAKRRQKDTQARWTKKHGRSRYGDKNHLSVDHRHKLIRSYQVTDAPVRDSQVFEELLDPSNTRAEVWADSAYRSAKIEAYLTGAGYRSRIHRKGARGKPLSARSKLLTIRQDGIRVIGLVRQQGLGIHPFNPLDRLTAICCRPLGHPRPHRHLMRVHSQVPLRNLSTTLRQWRLRFTEQFLLLWVSQVG